ncbi:MAG: lipopolysaccharide heptosyltransferase II [Pirellula sp.]
MLPNWVGDACMATPALRALRTELAADTSICWVGRPGPLGVLEGLAWSDKTLCYKPRSKTLLNRRQLVGALRAERFDTILYLTNSLSTALIGALAGIRRRIGYARDYRSWLLSDPVPVCTEHHNARKDPCIDNYLRLAQAMGCSASDRRTELALTHDDQLLAQSCLESIGLDIHRKLIVMNTGAATALTKRWPVEQAAAAARKLAQDLDVWVLIHCGPAERDSASSIETLANDPRVRSMGRFEDLPLGLSKSLIARSALVVSTDSGPRHIAVALNKPVVSLFGSIDPGLTRTYNVPETIVTLGLDCQPCGSYDCRFKHANCMNQLDSDRVVRAAKAVFGQSKSQSLHLANPR